MKGDKGTNKTEIGEFVVGELRRFAGECTRAWRGVRGLGFQEYKSDRHENEQPAEGNQPRLDLPLSLFPFLCVGVAERLG